MKNVLVYDNQWEYDNYYVLTGSGKEKIVTLTIVSINGKEYAVTSRMVRVPYRDMGHQYEANSLHYFVKESVFGIEKTFDLNEIIKHTTIIAIDCTSCKS